MFMQKRRGLAVASTALVAALALARALDDARDVDEGHRRRHGLLRVEELGELVEPRVGQVHHPDVRLDRREGVVRGEDLVLGQGVEQGRLADVRETDDSDGESHGPGVYGGDGRPHETSTRTDRRARPP